MALFSVVFPLLSIICTGTSIVNSLTDETVIQANTAGVIYNDNEVTSLSPPSPGWTTTPYTGRITWEADLGAGLNILGPYSGSFGSIVDDIIYIEQQFACSKDSYAQVRYYLLWCGETEQDDYAHLKLNDGIQPMTVINGLYSDWEGTFPSFASPVQSLDFTQCALGWNVKRFGFDTNEIQVTANELFKVTFEMGLSASNEWTGITQVQIKCTSFPTPNPTSPTNYPSNSPTKYPTKSPNKNISSTEISSAIIIGLLLAFLSCCVCFTLYYICRYKMKSSAERKATEEVNSPSYKPSYKPSIGIEKRYSEPKKRIKPKLSNIQIHKNSIPSGTQVSASNNSNNEGIVSPSANSRNYSNSGAGYDTSAMMPPFSPSPPPPPNLLNVQNRKMHRKEQTVIVHNRYDSTHL